MALQDEVAVGSVLWDDNGAWGERGLRYKVVAKDSSGVTVSGGKSIPWSEVGRATAITEGMTRMASTSPVAMAAFVVGQKVRAESSFVDSIRQTVPAGCEGEVVYVGSSGGYNVQWTLPSGSKMISTVHDAQAPIIKAARSSVNLVALSRALSTGHFEK